MKDFEKLISDAIEKYELQGRSFTYGVAVRELVRDGRADDLPIELRYSLQRVAHHRVVKGVQVDDRLAVEVLDVSEIAEIVDEYIDEYGADYE